MSEILQNFDYPLLEVGETSKTAIASEHYLQVLQNLEVKVEVSVGGCQMRIQQLRELKQQQIIALDQRCDESVSLLLNGKTIARGELLISNDHYAIKITEITGK